MLFNFYIYLWPFKPNTDPVARTDVKRSKRCFWPSSYWIPFPLSWNQHSLCLSDHLGVYCQQPWPCLGLKQFYSSLHPCMSPPPTLHCLSVWQLDSPTLVSPWCSFCWSEPFVSLAVFNCQKAVALILSGKRSFAPSDYGRTLYL